MYSDVFENFLSNAHTIVIAPVGLFFCVIFAESFMKNFRILRKSFKRVHKETKVIYQFSQFAFPSLIAGRR